MVAAERPRKCHGQCKGHRLPSDPLLTPFLPGCRAARQTLTTRSLSDGDGLGHTSKAHQEPQQLKGEHQSTKVQCCLQKPATPTRPHTHTLPRHVTQRPQADSRHNPDNGYQEGGDDSMAPDPHQANDART